MSERLGPESSPCPCDGDRFVCARHAREAGLPVAPDAIGVRLHGGRVVGREEVVHACPPNGSSNAPCCGVLVFELPRFDRLTLDPDLVTCRGRKRAEAETLPPCPFPGCEGAIETIQDTGLWITFCSAKAPAETATHVVRAYGRTRGEAKSNWRRLCGREVPPLERRKSVRELVLTCDRCKARSDKGYHDIRETEIVFSICEQLPEAETRRKADLCLNCRTWMEHTVETLRPDPVYVPAPAKE